MPHPSSSTFREAIAAAGVTRGMPVCVHVSMRHLRSHWPGITPAQVAVHLQDAVGNVGSLIVPTFTFNWKGRSGARPFDPDLEPSAVGAFSEVFRTFTGVIRTSSPTHSFALWGKARELGRGNMPTSPLGDGSPMAWLARQAGAAILLLGTDFSAMSFLHFVEHAANVPYLGTFPWAHLGIEPIGLSLNGEQGLTEIPGCSRSFVRMEQRLREEGHLATQMERTPRITLVPASLVLKEGVKALREGPDLLLCGPECVPCSVRRAACGFRGDPTETRRASVA